MSAMEIGIDNFVAAGAVEPAEQMRRVLAEIAQADRSGVDTFGIGEQIAELAGDERGVFLWESATYCCAAPQQLWGGPLWTIHDQTSVLLPRDLDEVPGYVATYAERFADRPLFLLMDTPDAVPTVPGHDVTEVRRFQGGLPHWEENSETRPDEAIIVPYDFSAYSVTPSGAAAG